MGMVGTHCFKALPQLPTKLVLSLLVENWAAVGSVSWVGVVRTKETERSSGVKFPIHDVVDFINSFHLFLFIHG